MLNSASKNLLETLLFKIPNILYIYKLLELPVLSSSEHKECVTIIDNFKNPKVIICNGLTVSCFIIERIAKNKYFYLTIEQEVFFQKGNIGDIWKRMDNLLKEKDFIPQPLSKKITLIEQYSKDGVFGKFYTSVNGKTKMVRGNLNSLELHKKEDEIWGDRPVKNFLRNMNYE